MSFFSDLSFWSRNLNPILNIEGGIKYPPVQSSLTNHLSNLGNRSFSYKTYVSVTKIKHHIMNISLPMFFVDLNPDGNKSEIFSIKSLLQYTRACKRYDYNVIFDK